MKIWWEFGINPGISRYFIHKMLIHWPVSAEECRGQLSGCMVLFLCGWHEIRMSRFCNVWCQFAALQGRDAPLTSTFLTIGFYFCINPSIKQLVHSLNIQYGNIYSIENTIFIVSFQFNLASSMIMMWWPWSHYPGNALSAEKLGPNIAPWLWSKMSEGHHQRIDPPSDRHFVYLYFDENLVTRLSEWVFMTT